MKQIGSTQITILDLVDYATYIYYAEDSQGTNATNTPNDNTKYIGVYCGPPVEGGQPETPVTGMEIEWMSYVGPKGDPGDQGPAGSSSRPLKTYLRKTQTFEWWQGKLGREEYWQYNSTGMAVSDAEWDAYYADIQIGDTVYFQIEASDTAQRYTYHGRVTAIDRKTVKTLGISLDLDGKDGASVTIKSQHYAIGDDGTTAPTPSGGQEDKDIWKTSTDQLILTQGKYLWTRIIYLSNEQEIVTYSINYIAKDGENGDAYEIKTTSEDLIYSYEKGNLVSLPADSIEYAARNKLTDEWVSFSDTNFSGEFKVVFDDHEYDLPDDCYFKTSLNFNDERRDCVSLDIGKINKLTCKEVTTEGSEESGSFVEKILSEGGYIVYYLTDNEKILAVKPLLPRYGTSREMAQFNSTATSINALVRRAAMEFNDSGLTITSSMSDGEISKVGLTIIRKTETQDGDIINIDEEKVFYVNSDGEVFLKGTVHATNGEFTGTIRSAFGEIGGFSIDGNLLKSQNQTLVMNGATGAIKVDNILLGAGATVANYLLFGAYSKTKDAAPQDGKDYYIRNDGLYSLSSDSNFKDGVVYYELNQSAKIQNPDPDNNNCFIKTNGISITADGKVLLGEAKRNQRSSTPGLYGNNWSITDDKAIFSNVVISGQLDTAVFNTNSTQAVGGAMLFMPSFKIQSCGEKDEKDYIVLEDASLIEKDQAVWIVQGNTYELAVIDSKEENTLFLKGRHLGVFAAADPVAVIALGNHPLVIGINSGETKVANSHILPRGLTITQYNNENETPDLFLGDLSSVGLKGYGLFSNNVALSGSLTTVNNQTGEYAGISTLSTVSNTKFTEYGDNSNIIFWAGADNTQSVKNANCFVTAGGSLYAQRARFDNYILTQGELHGADIYAARIHGEENGEAAALTIYDTAQGIVFKHKENGSGEEKETFTINSSGIIRGKTPIMDASDTGATFYGNSFCTEGSGSAMVALSAVEMDEENELVPGLYHKNGGNIECGLYFEQNKTTYRMGDKIKMVWEPSATSLIGTVAFAENAEDTSFQYKAAAGGGYDLYITERV